MECHRQQWRCGICDLNLSTRAAMAEHLKNGHGDQVPDGQEEIVTNIFGRPVQQINASDCVLCDYPSIIRARGHSDDEALRLSPERFGQHLSRHLEQVSLFVLPVSDLIDEDEMSETGVHGEESDSEDGVSESGLEILSEPDLVQKLIEVSSSQTGQADKLSDPPDLAMRWQPPQDFTPPLDDFYTDEVDLLPARQEPIFGGDLHTPGWARGSGRRKEGFCARCPISHWVNISDGSYAFHLTYFHGVPASGVPLPRPSVIRQVSEKAGSWEGYCEACVDWKLLRKTRRGWNWYRHWLNDHIDIVMRRTNAITNGTNPESIPLSTNTALPSFALEVNLHNSTFKEQGARSRGADFSQSSDLGPHLLSLAKNDKGHETEASIRRFSLEHTPEEIERLLEWTNDLNQNLLMISAAQGLYSTVELVLSFGGNPNRIDLEGQTALDLATDAGFFETAQLLIKNGADASRSHVFKRIFSNEREYAGEMTQAVADASHPDDFKISSLSALGQSALIGDCRSIRNLLGNNDGPSSCDIEEGAEMGTPAFLLACQGNHFEAADLLLSRGANINAVSRQGWTTLMLASKRDDAKLVSFLLSRGADVNHLSPDRWSALTEATSKGSTSIMRMLLGAGADPEVRAQSDWTPLMHAAYRGDIEAVELLLASGASFEEVSARDETPMLLAAASGNPTVVLRLLDAGCRPDSLWSMAQAEIRDTTDIIGEGSTGAAPPSPTAPRTAQERIERVYKVGWTPLMVAAQIGSLKIVEMLLNAGANPYSKSPMFKTVIEIAMENGRLDVAEYLEIMTERGSVI